MEKFTINKDKHIDYILDNFDFVKVQFVMNKLNWTWYDSDDTPTLRRLRETAKELLMNVYETKSENIYDIVTNSTGGFKATKYEDWLTLEFVITDKCSDFLNYGDEYEKIKKNRERNNKINQINKKR